MDIKTKEFSDGQFKNKKVVQIDLKSNRQPTVQDENVNSLLYSKWSEEFMGMCATNNYEERERLKEELVTFINSISHEFADDILDVIQ